MMVVLQLSRDSFKNNHKKILREGYGGALELDDAQNFRCFPYISIYFQVIFFKNNSLNFRRFPYCLSHNFSHFPQWPPHINDPLF